MKAAPAAAKDTYRQLIERALPEAQARAQLLREVRGALVDGDEKTAIVLMRKYCGLSPVSES